jgi:hypothetical protein
MPSPTPGVTGLRAIPGVKVAWKSMGHFRMTDDAVTDVMPTLSARQRQFVRVLADLPRKNVLQDIDRGNLMDFFFHKAVPLGQVRHFMRDRFQSNRAAYKLSVALIESSGADAAAAFGRFRRLEERWLGLPAMFAEGELEMCSESLSLALHVLQDSFSPAHTLRPPDRPAVLTQLYVYDEHNKEAREGWPGHGELDKQWKGTPLGKLCVDASIALIRCVAKSAEMPNPDASFRQCIATEVVQVYLKEQLPD